MTRCCGSSIAREGLQKERTPRFATEGRQSDPGGTGSACGAGRDANHSAWHSTRSFLFVKDRNIKKRRNSVPVRGARHIKTTSWHVRSVLHGRFRPRQGPARGPAGSDRPCLDPARGPAATYRPCRGQGRSGRRLSCTLPASRRRPGRTSATLCNILSDCLRTHARSLPHNAFP